jgi:type VI secretion system secreted protein Hcp
MAAVDFFLKIDGIPGESKDSVHKGEIDLISWSWGCSQGGTMSHGGGGGAGKVSMQDFVFTMRVNKSSPKLILACAKGAHIPSALLTVRKAGGKQEEFLKYKFEDVLVSSYNTGGSASNDAAVPIESVSFNYTKFEVSYAEQKKDGGLEGPVTANWSVKENKGG